MKKLIALSLVTIFAVITGCKPNEQPPDTRPSDLVGKWKAEFTTKIKRGTAEQDANVTIGMTTEASGSASFEQVIQIDASKFSPPPQTETVTGSWEQTGHYLIVERDNGGFVALRISSQSTNQLTVFDRLGQTIQFNRVP